MVDSRRSQPKGQVGPGSDGTKKPPYDVIVEGLFLMDENVDDIEPRNLVISKRYRPSVKGLKLTFLEVTKEHRLTGVFGKDVIAVYDLSHKTHWPFYVTPKEAMKIRLLQRGLPSLEAKKEESAKAAKAEAETLKRPTPRKGTP